MGSSLEFIFCMTTADHTLEGRRVKDYGCSDGLHLHIHVTLLNWPQLITICFVLFVINYLDKKKFDDENDLKMDLANFFTQKSQDFY